MRLRNIIGGLLLALFAGLALLPASGVTVENTGTGKVVYVIPIREDIMPPLTYLVRRGVKEAMEAHADLLVLDMDTNGGRIDTTEEIINILNQFKGRTVTFVNRRAFSAGAFISVSTQQIFMAPQSVIGAAAPITISPGGSPSSLPDTVEAKMTSAVLALVRTSAEKNGYNIAVVESMVDKSRELKIDGETLNEKGQILTLTNLQAEKGYGNPKKNLLSSGTIESLDALLAQLHFGGAEVHRIEPLGAEKLAFWLNALGPLLLIIGAGGIYIEMKTPGFGVPGVVGILAFALYFLGGYVAGLAGMEWLAVFLIGLAMVMLELFVFPGHVLPGVIGAGMMFVAVVMGTVDFYPGTPRVPSMSQLRLPLTDLGIAGVGSVILIFVLSRWLPKTSFYGRIVSQTASGMVTVETMEKERLVQIGQQGVTISALRPGGKAQFGDQILDVMSQGDMIAKGQRVRIIGHSAAQAVVELVG